MKRLLRAAARLYPRAWRERHGEEFDALIDDLTPAGGMSSTSRSERSSCRSRDSTQAAQQAAVKATGSIIEAAFLASPHVARSAGVQFQGLLATDLPTPPPRA